MTLLHSLINRSRNSFFFKQRQHRYKTDDSTVGDKGQEIDTGRTLSNGTDSSTHSNTATKALGSTIGRKSLRYEIETFLSSLNVNPSDRDMMEETTRDLIDLRMAETAVKESEFIHDFCLPDMNNIPFDSKEALKKGPMIIVFYRGAFCPVSNMQLIAMQEKLEEIKDLNAQLVAISPNLLNVIRATVQKNNIEYHVLSDMGNVVARQFGLVFQLDKRLRPVYKHLGYDIQRENGNDSFELPLASTYVVDVDGKIVYSYIEADYTKRPEPEDIIAVLQALDKNRSVP